MQRILGHMRNSARHQQRGHLLLDTMVGIFVGSTVLMGTVSLVITGSVAAAGARQNTVATNAARQILENVRMRRSAVLADGTYADATVFGPVPQLAALRGGSASVRVATWQATIKSVVVTVTWRSGQRGGQTKTQVVTGLIGPRGATL
jgi:hypothetical protein